MIMTDTLYVIGAGAAGSSLAHSLQQKGHNLIGVMDRDAGRADTAGERLGVPATTRFHDAIKEADIVIVSVSDQAIETVAETVASHDMAARHQVWLHLSGALTPLVLKPLGPLTRGIGAFHPAHVFPPGRITPISPGTRFGVAGNKAAVHTTQKLAAILGCDVVVVHDTIRPRYHAATVLASNAVVALIAEAVGILENAGISSEDAEALLLSLSNSAVENSRRIGLKGGLTGPIQRGDINMVKRHLDALRDTPHATALYQSLGKSIVRLAKAGDGSQADTLDTILAMLSR